MTEQTDPHAPPGELRRRAEQLAREVAAGAPAETLPVEETRRLLHELRVHQIELEMQNEELRKIQDELAVSRARYFDLYDLAPVGYLSVSEAGLILEANLTFASILGLDRARGALLMRPLTSFVLPEDQDVFYLHRKQLLETHVPQVCRMRMLRADGSQFWARLQATLAEDSDRGVAFLVVVSDITELRHAEDEQAALQEQFNQSQKMESVGRLAGGVAHDLNNLLMPILGYGEMLLSDFGPDDSRKRYVEEMVRAAERARDLVRQLLAFSRKQIGVFAPIDVNETVAGFAMLLKRTIREDIVIDYISSRCPLSILGDKGQLEQVIMNLAVNAQDAMPKGGALTIETSLAEVGEADSATCEGLAPGRYALLTVSDSGTGMNAETQSHIFEPFFTTKILGKGVGLGLATVYGIVKQHGGGISVSSEGGRGTTFSVWLPALEGQEGYSEAGPGDRLSVVGSDLGGDETILLVEDQLEVRVLVQTMLERLGYDVLTAGTGGEAFQVLERCGTPVHLVLTDVIMPGINGRELAARIQDAYPDMKALLMSGYADAVVAQHGVLDVGTNFIQKPFSKEALAARVREVLDARKRADS